MESNKKYNLFTYIYLCECTLAQCVSSQYEFLAGAPGLLPRTIKKKPHILVDIQPASSTECTDVVPRQCSSAEKRFHWISSSIYEQRGNQQSAEWHSLSFGVWGISFQHVDGGGTATSWYKTMATARVFFLFSIRLAPSVVAAANHVPPSHPNRLHPPLSHLLTSCPLSLLP